VRGHALAVVAGEGLLMCGDLDILHGGMQTVKVPYHRYLYDSSTIASKRIADLLSLATTY
jgi:hypothetical protein